MQEVKDSLQELMAGLASCGLKLNQIPVRITDKAADIHISAGTPIRMYCTDGEIYNAGNKVLTSADISDLFHKLCDYSVYRHQNEIKEGFITIFGKYRCGIAGTAVSHRGEIVSVRNISSLNIRIPRLVIGAADDIFRCKADLLNGLLLIGEPSSGKTTVLRDIIPHLQGKRCVVVDERRELTAGFGSLDVDVLLDYSKSTAISQAIRSLSPQFILCDELDDTDIPAIKHGMAAGVSFLASAHGKISAYSPLRPLIFDLLSTGVFGNVAILSGREAPGKIKEVKSAVEFLKGYRLCDDYFLRSADRSESKQKITDKSIYA